MDAKKVSVFISYSHLDKKWFNAEKKIFGLIPFLEDSLAQKDVKFWYDRQKETGIEAGDKFKNSIEEQIDKADIALLLISQEFLNSRFIMEIELPRIQERYKKSGLNIFPVLLEPCDWQEIEFISSLHIVPGNPTPLIEFTENEIGWTKVRHEILTSLKKKIEKIREFKNIDPGEKVEIKKDLPEEGSKEVLSQQKIIKPAFAYQYRPITGLLVRDNKGREAELTDYTVQHSTFPMIKYGFIISSQGGTKEILWDQIESLTVGNANVVTIKFRDNTTLDNVEFSPGRLIGTDRKGFSHSFDLAVLQLVNPLPEVSVSEYDALVRDIPLLVQKASQNSSYSTIFELEPDQEGILIIADLLFQGRPATNGHLTFRLPGSHTFSAKNTILNINIVPTGSINLSLYDRGTAFILAFALNRLNTLLSEKIEDNPVRLPPVLTTILQTGKNESGNDSGVKTSYINHENIILLNRSADLAVGTKDSKKRSFYYPAGSVLKYIEKGAEKSSSWYRIAGASDTDLFLYPYIEVKEEASDDRIFFRISETGQVGYLVDIWEGRPQLYSSFSEIGIADLDMGDIKIPSEQISLLTAKKNEISIKKSKGGTFRGGLRNIANYRNESFTMGPCLITNDATIALIRTVRENQLTLTRIADNEKPPLTSGLVFWDRSQLKFRLTERDDIGFFDESIKDSCIQFSDNILGWMRISIPHIKRLTINVGHNLTQVIVETFYGNIYKGTCPEQINLSGTMISFDKYRSNQVFEALDR